MSTQLVDAPARLPRERLQELAARRDGPGLRRLTMHLSLLAATTAGMVRAPGWWKLAAAVPDGLVLSHLFALEHECVHRTAFATGWLNRHLGTVAGVAVGVAPEHFRLEHLAHHRFTQDPERDPELLDVPAGRGAYLLALTGLPYWRWTLTAYATHAAGRLMPGETAWIPPAARPRVFREARWIGGLGVAVLAAGMAGTAGIGGTAAVGGRVGGVPVLTWPLVYWWLPRFLGEPVMRVVRLAEHAGRPKVADPMIGTRSLRVTAPMQLLAWNMNFHAEHHAEPAVPFHALPALHAGTGRWVAGRHGGYLAAHRDIWRQLPR